jgi:hypothetical protein
MAAPKILSNGPAAQSSILSKWPAPKAHVAEQLRGIPGYAIAVFEATLITPVRVVKAAEIFDRPDHQ